jgi:hypothetical protein
MKRPLLLLFAAVVLLASGADYAAEGRLWWAHVQFLADDRLQGRNVGTEGFQKAAEYVAGQFRQLGLKPAGTKGYFQPIKFETYQVEREQSSLELVRNGQAQKLDLGVEASINPRAGSSTIEAPMVFVGYGMVIPEAHYDDLAGLDLHGKIAVFMNATGPVEAPFPVKSHFSSPVERWNALRKAGAIGVATIPNPRQQAARSGADDEPAARGSSGPRPPQISFVLTDPSLREMSDQSVALTITARGAPKFFEGAEHTFEEIQALASNNQPLPKFPLPATLRVKATVKRGTADSVNVVAMLPGSDRSLKKEYVVMSAHLDHVGVGRVINGDNIYNGAMDDASGIASVIEVARLLKRLPHPPKRSVLFVAVTAEEKGELGSRYFAAHPTVAARSIVADINLDMFLPLYPLKYLEVQGLEESTLGDTVRAAAQSQGVEAQLDNEPEQNRFIRSDQYSFIRRGIPALAFKFGYAAGSPEEKIRKDWVRERYHRPSDDLLQPVDTAAAAQFDRVILELIQRVANEQERPHWNQNSFFRRFTPPAK